MLSKFDYVKPASLNEALSYLSQNDGTRILAGGTDLLVVLRRNMENIQHILDIKGVPETKKIEYTPDKGLFIGASITANQVGHSREVIEKYPAIGHGVEFLASYQLRNRATLVGNICNASPGGDMSAPLLIYDAILHIAGAKGNREVSIKSFFTGVKKTVLKRDEIVIGLTIPEVEANDRSIYLKQARLKGHDLATVGVAIRVDSQNKVYIAMAAVAPTPIRLEALEAEINSRGLSQETIAWASEQVHNHIKPISYIRSSAEYRLHIASVFVKQGLLKLMDKGVN